MSAPTAFVGGTGTISHVSDAPTYVAPASRTFVVAPAGHTYLPPPSNTYIPAAGHMQPHEVSSGKGISVDSNA
jgi:hypothetical protein